jgi:hypothetical protein
MRLPEVLDSLYGCRTVLRELRGSVGDRRLVVIAAYWGWRDLAAGWSKNRLPGAWPWRSSETDEDPDAGCNYFWATSGLSDAEVDSLLFAAADDQSRFVIGAPGLEWLYCLYDGGLMSCCQVRSSATLSRHAIPSGCPRILMVCEKATVRAWTDPWMRRLQPPKRLRSKVLK